MLASAGTEPVGPWRPASPRTRPKQTTTATVISHENNEQGEITDLYVLCESCPERSPRRSSPIVPVNRCLPLICLKQEKGLFPEIPWHRLIMNS